MTFFGFYREAAWRSLHRAWEMGHTAHALIIFGTGAFVLLGWHFGEHELVVIPFLVLLGAFLIGVLWFAFVIYRDEHGERSKDNNKNADKITELEKTVQVCRTPKVVILDEVDPGEWRYHFRIKVKNESDSTAERVGVHLFRGDPFMSHLPVPLHCSHEIRPHSDEVNLNPGATRTFDVLRIGSHVPGVLDIAGAKMEEVIPLQKYRLTLRVHGRDFPPTEKDFIFDPKPDGTFAFYAAPETTR